MKITMEREGYVGNLACFLLGVAVGAITALLSAPQTGRRTRRLLREKMEDGVEAISEAGRDLRAEGRNLVKRANSLVGRAKTAMQ